MGKASPHVADSLDALLEALTGAAAILEWPLPRERDEAVCDEMARATDALLVMVARGRGALDVSLGERLDVLGTGDRVLRLGYAGIGDCAREELGIAGRSADHATGTTFACVLVFAASPVFIFQQTANRLECRSSETWVPRGAWITHNRRCARGVVERVTDPRRPVRPTSASFPDLPPSRGS